MVRSIFIGMLFLVWLTACGSTPAQKQDGNLPAIHTDWHIASAEGIDALLLIGAASGDVMQADIYGDSIERVRKTVSPEGLAAMDQIDSMLRGEMGRLTGPVLAYFFSAGPVSTLDDVIMSAADPVGRLQPGHEQSSHWDAQEFEGAVQMMPTLHTALVALRDAGFTEWYEDEHRQNIAKAVEVNRLAVDGFDVIPEQERLLGRELDKRIEILIVNFAKPYGIKILGQRFVAYYGWPGHIQLQVAAHEIFHSPFDGKDEDLKELLNKLRDDLWMTSIVENHDPRFGYNSFMGVIDEDSTQALDQIVSERLGFSEEPGQRWRKSDGGMHMFAAAVYHAMKEDGFANDGGHFSEWFKSALKRGLLSPGEVRRRAALVVDQEAVDAWGS